ncbi:MAG: transposase [Pseudonocardiales bacterium]
MPAEVEFYLGLDWAAEMHAVCVLDAAGKVMASFPVPHSADGIAALITRLGRLGEPEQIPVGIERPRGRLVDLLVEAGHPVSPNAIKTWRDGEVLSGAKSDAGATAVIAEYLRLRAHRLRAVPGYSKSGKARAGHFRWACNVRILARAWIRIIWRCWQDGVPYNPASHGNAIKINQQPTAA